MKTLIWPLPTRIFHWMLAIGFTAAYILGDQDDLRNLHFAFGALVGSLLVLRILYGLFGPRYSRFVDFPISVSKIKLQFEAMVKRNNPFNGHNPLASIVMIGIMITGILCSFSGYLLYTENNGIPLIAANEDVFEEMHEVMANVFLGLVIAHLAGIFADAMLHPKSGTFLSIFTGFKNVEDENVKLNGFQKAFAVVWLLVPFILFYWAFNLPNEKSQEKEKNKIENYKESEDDD